MKKLILITAFTIGYLPVSAQTPSPHQFTISTGFSAVNNQFYTVNTLADMRFDKVNGFRFDVQYGYRILPRVHLNAGLGFVNHSQTLRIHSHHFEPTISPNADSYETENHQRRFINLTTGVNFLVREAGSKKRLTLSVPVGVQNLIGVHRSYQTNGQGNWENLAYESWFWGLYTGVLLDYRLTEGTSLRFAPTATKFFTQYPHYTGSQHAFDFCVGVVFNW